MRRRLVLAALALVVVAAPADAATVTELPELSGPWIDVNAAGVVSGQHVTEANPVGRPAIWRKGVVTELPLPTLSVPTDPSPTGTARAINDAGVVVGGMSGVRGTQPPTGARCGEAYSGTGVVWTPDDEGVYSAAPWGWIDPQFPISQPVGITAVGAVVGNAWRRTPSGPPFASCVIEAFITEGATPTAQTPWLLRRDLLAVASNGLRLIADPLGNGCGGPGDINASGWFWCGKTVGIVTGGGMPALPAGFLPAAVTDDDRVAGALMVPVRDVVPASPTVTETIRRATIVLATGRLVDLDAQMRAAAPAAFRAWVFGRVDAAAKGRYVVEGCNPQTYAASDDDPTRYAAADDAECRMFLFSQGTRITGQVTEPALPGAGAGAAARAAAKTRPARGVKVRVTGPGGVDTTVTTDAAGRFAVDLPAAGTFRVALVGRAGCIGTGACRPAADVAVGEGDAVVALRVDAAASIAVPVVGASLGVRRGSASVPVLCRQVAAPCRGALVVRRPRGAVVVRRQFTVPAGARRAVAVKVGRKRGAVRVTASVTVGRRAVSTTRATRLVGAGR